MNQYWKNREVVRVSKLVLLGSHDALKNWVDCLQVRRVSGKRDFDLSAVPRGEYTFGSQMVLHISRALDARNIVRALELPEYLPVGLAGDVRQNVQATTVGHSDDRFVQSAVRCRLQDLV